MNRFHLWHMIAPYINSIDLGMSPAKAGIIFLSDAAFLCYGLGFVHWQ